MRNTLGQRFQKRIDVPVWLERRQLSYADKVLSVLPPDNLVGYWKQDEDLGGIAIDSSPRGNDGAYTGVTLGQAGIGDGLTSPLFDGANDYNNIYSAGFEADLDTAEGGCLAWAQVSGGGVWTDATTRRVISVRADINNRFAIGRFLTDNIFRATWAGGGTTEIIVVEPANVPDNDWMCLLLTWSNADDEVRFYFNGMLQTTPQTGIGVWVGALNVGICNIGSQTQPGAVWDGTVAHVAIWGGVGVPAALQAAAPDLAIP